MKFNLKNWRTLLSYDRKKLYEWFEGFEAELRERLKHGKLTDVEMIKEILGE